MHGGINTAVNKPGCNPCKKPGGVELRRYHLRGYDPGCGPDLPGGTGSAVIIDASDITLDLGGHTISGDPFKTGVMVDGQDGVTIRNGTIDGFNDGIFLINTTDVIVEHLTISNLTVADTNHFVFGVQIINSHNVNVSYMQFEFLPFPHKEAVEVFASDVSVSNITVQGGGAGVSFSFDGNCDPVNTPSNGTVTDSTFLDIAVAGIWISCSSDLLIENNYFSTTPGGYGLLGIQGDAPFSGAVTGVIIRENTFYKNEYGIELRGILNSTITHNSITHNVNWGIMVSNPWVVFETMMKVGFVSIRQPIRSRITSSSAMAPTSIMKKKSAGTPGSATSAASRWELRSRIASPLLACTCRSFCGNPIP